LFFAALAYLLYHQIATLNWNKLQKVAEDTITILANAIIQIPGLTIQVATAMLLRQPHYWL
jgi:hypothetical protein